MWYGGFRPYVSVAQRRAKAAHEIAKRRQKGQTVTPVVIEGRTIAHTFWGQAWCDNLESYSDFANRLPRGRTYVRNGSVVDLQIQPGQVTALVSGSELYEVEVAITPLPNKVWQGVKSRCAGQIGSIVELLAGRLSKNVIAIVTAHEGGLFPKPSEIEMSCSCPDWAGMCKHIAAVLYGVGARLDHQPDLLFSLRKVDHLQLIEEAVTHAGKKTTTRKKTLAEADVAAVFGIEIAEAPAAPPRKANPRTSKTAKPRRSPKTKTVGK
ncbi:MAG TPA: SWIM zinc finger family protein [Gemmataceae bacterium]|nr:SWIM zinc finger family protein [Gemmataceae bacterium]